MFEDCWKKKEKAGTLQVPNQSRLADAIALGPSQPSHLANVLAQRTVQPNPSRMVYATVKAWDQYRRNHVLAKPVKSGCCNCYRSLSFGWCTCIRAVLQNSLKGCMNWMENLCQTRKSISTQVCSWVSCEINHVEKIGWKDSKSLTDLDPSNLGACPDTQFWAANSPRATTFLVKMMPDTGACYKLLKEKLALHEKMIINRSESVLYPIQDSSERLMRVVDTIKLYTILKWSRKPFSQIWG